MKKLYSIWTERTPSYELYNLLNKDYHNDKVQKLFNDKYGKQIKDSVNGIKEDILDILFKINETNQLDNIIKWRNNSLKEELTDIITFMESPDEKRKDYTFLPNGPGDMINIRASIFTQFSANVISFIKYYNCVPKKCCFFKYNLIIAITKYLKSKNITNTISWKCNKNQDMAPLLILVHQTDLPNGASYPRNMDDYPIYLKDNKTLNSIINTHFDEEKNESDILAEIETDINIEDKEKKLYYLLKFYKNLSIIIDTIGNQFNLYPYLELGKKKNILTPLTPSWGGGLQQKLNELNEFIIKFKDDGISTTKIIENIETLYNPPTKKIIYTEPSPGFLDGSIQIDYEKDSNSEEDIIQGKYENTEFGKYISSIEMYEIYFPNELTELYNTTKKQIVERIETKLEEIKEIETVSSKTNVTYDKLEITIPYKKGKTLKKNKKQIRILSYLKDSYKEKNRKKTIQTNNDLNVIIYTTVKNNTEGTKLLQELGVLGSQDIAKLKYEDYETLYNRLIGVQIDNYNKILNKINKKNFPISIHDKIEVFNTKLREQLEKENISMDEQKFLEELKALQSEVFKINSDDDYIILKDIYGMGGIKPQKLSLQEQIREYTLDKPWLNDRQNCSINAKYKYSKNEWDDKDCEDFKEDDCKVACNTNSKNTLCVKKKSIRAIKKLEEGACKI